MHQTGLLQLHCDLLLKLVKQASCSGCLRRRGWLRSLRIRCILLRNRCSRAIRVRKSSQNSASKRLFSLEDWVELDIVHEGTFALVATVPNIVEQFHLEIDTQPQAYSNSRHIVPHTVHNDNDAAVVVQLHRQLRSQRPLTAINLSRHPHLSSKA